MPRPRIASPPENMTVDEAVQAAIDYELEQRRWLRVLLPVLWDQTPPASSAAVEYGRNLVRLAASARVCRILRSDMPSADRLTEGQADQTALTSE
jgi:hypothetical protein